MLRKVTMIDPPSQQPAYNARPLSNAPNMRVLIRTGLLMSLMCIAGCAAIVNRATDKLSNGLTAGVSNHDDIATVADGLPAYLLLLDGLITQDPENPALLLAAAQLYGTYAGGFIAEPDRTKRLADRSFNYAKRGICVRDAALCAAIDSPDFAAYQKMLAQNVQLKDVSAAYTLAGSWVTWLRADTGDFDRIAQLPRIEALLTRIHELNATMDHGNALAYLGVLDCLRPQSLGGNPDRGQERLTAASAVSGGRNLFPDVLNAEYCARLVFDQDSHDRLLQNTVQAQADQPGLTLANTIAKQRAQALLVSGKDYF
jgi:TRAP transporter T-component